jgi:hypothetical protein
MATTYVQIGSTVTVGVGGAASIDFSSIPSTYTDLVVKVSARTNTNSASNGQFLNLKLNNSTANFTYRFLFGNGSSAGSGNGSTGIVAYVNPSDYTASTFGNAEIYIPNYAGNTNKSISIDSVNENNATSAETALWASLWSNTAAVNQVTLVPFAGNFVQYSTASLYGISKS